MKSFDCTAYSELIKDLIRDTTYVNNSPRSKLAGLRDFTEILVRKILDIGDDEKIMLRDITIKSKSPKISSALSGINANLRNHFINTIENINSHTRDAHHTQKIKYSDNEVVFVENLILDLYAIIFIQYFMDIKIDIYSEPEISSRFSLLPPIIRYKTWNYLYSIMPNNIMVVDKLLLSIIKVNDKTCALGWLEENKQTIMSIPYPNSEEIFRYKWAHRVPNDPSNCKISLDFDSFINMYDLLINKVNDPRTSLNENGKLYKNFEEAKLYFEMFKTDTSNESKELRKLQDLMEFVYLGR